MGLEAVEARDRIAPGAELARHRIGTADERQQQVGGGVVAGRDRRLHQVADGHAALSDMAFGDGRIGQQVGLAIGNAPVERDRKSVVEGKSVSVRVDLGGRGVSKKKKTTIVLYTGTKRQKNRIK